MSKFQLIVEDLPDGGLKVEFSGDGLVHVSRMLAGEKTSAAQNLAILIANELAGCDAVPSQYFAGLIGENNGIS